MNIKNWLLPLIIFFYLTNVVGQEGYFQLRGRIYNKSKESLSNVNIQVTEGVNIIGSDKTSQQGVFSLRFKLNKSYIVIIGKDNYVTKRLIVDTQVPNEKEKEFFDLFSLIILDEEGHGDIRSKNGLPVSKYYYRESIADFTGEKITNKQVTVNNEDNVEVKKLQAELNSYKILVEEQKKMLNQAEEIVSDANDIKTNARYFADSIIKAANKRALAISVQDTNKIAEVALEKSTQDITDEELKNFSIDKEQFNSNTKIKQIQQRISSLKNQQNKTSRDSLTIKKERLSLRKELFDLAKYQLEIDKLNARTKEDSMQIEQREAQLYLMEQELAMADQEIENANNKLKLKDLEIKNKNIVLLSFLVGSILLLILLGIIYYNYRDKKRINKILEFQNQELEKLSIVASETSNAVIITDKDGNYTWVNQGYTRLFGYELEEVAGKNPRSLLDTNNDSTINDAVKKALTGKAVNYELETSSKTGDKIWIQTTLTPIIDTEGKVSKLIVIDSDISEIKKAELEILTQSKLLKKQNDQIMDSINYGKRIQDAILPSESLIKSYFPDSFIYFKPRDIVSGDFYWFSVQEDKLFVAAVDCTGHGVPGAFMSLIGNSLLNHIVNERKIYKPSEILKELNAGVNKALSQSKDENEDREDGMDLTICRFDKKKKVVNVACANHTALIIRGEEVKEIEGDEISIGETYSKVKNLQFTDHEIPFESSSAMYLFSDGFPDQIGGPKNKKFMVGKFKDILTEHQDENMEVQVDKLNENFKAWKGDNKQTDDILVLGIRLL